MPLRLSVVGLVTSVILLRRRRESRLFFKYVCRLSYLAAWTSLVTSMRANDLQKAGGTAVGYHTIENCFNPQSNQNPAF
jgi:hypothetical protein